MDEQISIHLENVALDQTRKNILAEEFSADYFLSLKRALIEERKKFHIFPPAPLIFNAFNITPFDKVSVVILGQDPYHGPGQAMGLSFSVPVGEPLPPSLRNIFQEIQNDVAPTDNLLLRKKGDLTSRAKQGVLLLNSVLTVRSGQAASHQHLGRQYFTDRVIKQLSEKKDNVVFLLWGNFARSKKALIDTSKHLVLESVHPSPLSAHAGFLGCKHFSATNVYLKAHGKQEISRGLL